MEINEFIRQNETIAPRVQAFANEIERLKSLRLLLRERSESCPVNLPFIQKLNRKIHSATELLKTINEIYDEQCSIKADPQTHSAILGEIKQGMDEIDDFIMKMDVLK